MTAPVISRDLNDYGFQTDVRVRLSETDAVGIVFFGSFASYMDVGRMDYLAYLKVTPKEGRVPGLIPGAVVSQVANFHAPARYNNSLLIHVRMARIGRTSYTLHFLITRKRTRETVSTGALTLAWLDDDFKPMRVPAEFRDAVRAFEGDRLVESK
ncbi:MAG: acyl-CoA thioesterase [Deltaproteobacteria bacterium]|nr:acyl-CoA thioesterase [Deltaproteobacteria bacterium]